MFQSPAGMNISALAQETMCYIGQQLVFTEAEQVINHLSGAAVNAKQIERVCHHYGQALEDENQQVIAQQVYKAYGAEQVDQRYYVSVDGAMYLTREESWKENKLGRIYGQHDRAEISKGRAMLTDSTYVSHLGDHQEFITKMDYHLENLNQLVFIADGARWIWKWIDATYPESTQIVDFYHVKEHLCAFAKLYFQDQEQRTAWTEQMSEVMLSEGISPVMAALRALPRQKGSHQKREGLLRYLSKNEARMQYHDFTEKGMLIGSGAIESAHRDVLQERMKLSGQRWTLAGFQQMAQLRVAYKNKAEHRIVNLCKQAS